MIEYNLDDDEEPIGEPIFGKSITQEDRTQAALKEHGLARQREDAAMLKAARRAVVEAFEDRRQA